MVQAMYFYPPSSILVVIPVNLVESLLDHRIARLVLQWKDVDLIGYPDTFLTPQQEPRSAGRSVSAEEPEEVRKWHSCQKPFAPSAIPTVNLLHGHLVLCNTDQASPA